MNVHDHVYMTHIHGCVPITDHFVTTCVAHLHRLVIPSSSVEVLGNPAITVTFFCALRRLIAVHGILLLRQVMGPVPAQVAFGTGDKSS